MMLESAKSVADEYLKKALELGDRSHTATLCFLSLNLFLWHLDAFEEDGDPEKKFCDKFQAAINFLDNLSDSHLCSNRFPQDQFDKSQHDFEDEVSGLFSDVWVDMTDDIYFDQSFVFTKERFERNGLDPYEFFGGKVVADCGCGSGKFSHAIAKFGAKRVVGIDIGKQGLDFAQSQSKKVDYGSKVDFVYGNLLDLPFSENSFDLVWSNGVIHHTLDYEKCIQEFGRVLNKHGQLFLYVNGRFGLFEILQDTIRKSMANVPRSVFQKYVSSLGVNSGRLYWIMDCCFAPYEWKSKNDVIKLLEKHGFSKLKQLTRGVETDQIEKISSGEPFATIKYGEGQLKFIAERS